MAIANYSKYENDDDGIHRVRTTTERVTAGGPAPAGDVDQEIDAKISKPNGAFGLRPRYVSLSRIIGTSPNQSRVRTTLAILTKTAFDAIDKDDTISIGSTAWTVVNKHNESYA